MEDSVAIKRVVMVCYKRKWSFRYIYKWVCPHITFAHTGIAESKKSERESSRILFARIFFVPVLGFICLIDQVEGESSLSDKFTSLLQF